MGRREVPVDPGAGPVQRFAYELRKLRQDAGGITYRALAQRAGYSVTTLSQAAAGEQLPTLSVALAYVRACGGEAVEWEARWGQAVNEAAAQPIDADGGAGADLPYRGLARFETRDSGRFFGREQLTGDVVELLRRQRFAAVFGPSGSGKSSLLRAGLIPALQHTREAALRPAAIRILTPGDRPARTQGRHFTPTATCPASASDTLVIVDQFEEVFTLCRDPAERARFLDMLLTARRPESRLRVLLAVRADFYGRCAEHRELAEALRDANVLVGPMTAGELRDAIVKPAAADGLTVERALTAHLVEEVADAPGGLPLLSHVLLETWRRRRGKVLTMAGYQAAGGLGGAIATTAEEVYATFTEGQKAAARRVLLRLVAPGEGTPDTRRPAQRTELEVTADGQETAHVLEQLVRARLLTLDDDTGVNLAHEALLTAWPRLRAWIEEDRERLRAHRKLTEAARTWEELGHEAGALYRGSRLAAAQEHFGGDPGEDLTDLEGAFLTASYAAREEDERAAARTTRRLRALTATLSALLVLALVASLMAWHQSRVSEQRREAADAARQAALSRQLAAQSAALLDTEPDLASLLAVQSYQTSPISQAMESLYAAAAMPLQHVLTGHSKAVIATAFSRDGRTLTTAGTDGAVRKWDTRTGRLRNALPGDTSAGDEYHPVELSPDGRTMATEDTTGVEKVTVQLRDTSTGRLRGTLPELTAGVGPLAFSPDGRTLATGRMDHGVQLWDVSTGRLRRSLPEVTADVGPLVFSSDGRTLATGRMDHGVQLWDTSTGRLRRTLPERTADVVLLAFSPDGRTLATGSLDRSVELWDSSTGRLRRTLPEKTDDIRSLVFSPDGRTLATGSADYRIRLWDTGTGRLRETFPGHTDTLLSITFSPDGRSLATGSLDNTSRLWHLPADQKQATLPEHLKETDEAGFSGGGRTLATGSLERSVELWDSSTGRLRSSLPEETVDVRSLAFSPDGRTLATGSQNRGVQLWDTSTGHLLRSLAGYTGVADTLAFSSDGHTLATGSVHRGAELWNASTGRLRRIQPEEAIGMGASTGFSPDGRTLVIGGEDGTVGLWDTSTGKLRTSLPGHSDTVGSLEFSPDGRTLATGSADHTVRLWDTGTGRTRGSLPGYAAEPGALAFSPDGDVLATSSIDDHTVGLWDARSGSRLATFSGHTDTVFAAAFSPDGRTLTTGSIDQTVRRWKVDLPTPTAAIDKICRTIGRDLTARERSVYLPDQPHDVCKP
ncbi:helix-turn-helix domain-containing protein [Streptomyces sp. CNQ-509]|uniref:nSTAND1 domain-containing NTPase n=1 Tax=Streptomyces sp. CNQ-509 TaxID=444103 RepID=UPI003463C0E5